MKFSIIWSIPKEDLQSLIYSCSSFVEVLNKLNLKHDSGGNYKTLKNRIAHDNIDISKLLCSRYKKSKTLTNNVNELLTNNSKTSRSRIKHIILQYNLLEYICNKCGLKDSWQNEKLVLQLEHKNGISNDHSINNLCFLCPNCHSQTKTFAGKKNKKPPNICLDCSIPISKHSKRCRKCQAQIKSLQQQKFKVSKNKLIQLLKTYNISQIAKKYNVSYTTVKKYCQKFNIITRV